MQIEQYVMAYEAEQDRLRAMLPDGFVSLRPVLRINAEIRYGDHEIVYVELNTAVETASKRGWLNIAHWDSMSTELSYQRNGKTVTFIAPFLEITYTGVGIEGGCPAEKDNDGCFFLGENATFIPVERIDSNREFCDYAFAWKFTGADAHGISTRKTLPAFWAEPRTHYSKQDFTVPVAVSIPCEQILGAYVVRFER